MSDTSQAEYVALRDTIRERGSVRLCAVLSGFIAWAALAIALLIAELDGGATLLPFLVLAGTFEINFFIHTGVERIGRYIQVFYEERAGAVGWETTAMRYGAKFRSGLDPLFSVLFAAAATLNFFTALLMDAAPGMDRAFTRRASRLRLQNRRCEENVRRLNARSTSIAFAISSRNSNANRPIAEHSSPISWFVSSKLLMSESNRQPTKVGHSPRRQARSFGFVGKCSDALERSLSPYSSATRFLIGTKIASALCGGWYG